MCFKIRAAIYCGGVGNLFSPELTKTLNNAVNTPEKLIRLYNKVVKLRDDDSVPDKPAQPHDESK